MRMIEQLVKVLSKVLFNKKEGNFQQAINDIETSFKNLVGLDYGLINASSFEGIISLIEFNKNETTANIKYILIAKLIKERADIKVSTNPLYDDIIMNYRKALNLFLEGILSNKNDDIPLNDFYPDVKEIAKKLENELSNDERFKLFKFYKKTGEKNKAEIERIKLKSVNYHGIDNEGIKF